MSQSESKFDAFMNSLPETLPTNPIIRIQCLARELALGHCNGLWNDRIRAAGHVDQYGHNYLRTYSVTRWKTEDFGNMLQLLWRNEYLDSEFHLTKTAYDLITQSDPYNIFISYKRSESSMFSLLVNSTLMLNGFAPFFDMMLDPTEEWHARLEKQVQGSDYFIALLGSQTHESKYTVREIFWALRHEIPVVQLWQFGFVIEPEKWQASEYPEVAIELQRQQAIEVKTDDAEGYHLALEKLLNAVGVTP